VARDDELITRTVQDYLEGWYDADAARMDRALHPGPVKRSAAGHAGAILTKEIMRRACAEGEGTGAADVPLTIGVADGCGDIAGAVVRPAPCGDYLHLIRTSDGWKIANALWLRT
jgi:putative lumazine-binding protein